MSNLASFVEQLVLLDCDTSQPMDLRLALDIVVTIADPAQGSGPFGRPVLQGSVKGGEIVLATDALSATISFTRHQMRTLCAKTYAIGARLIFEDDKDEQQMLLGYLPVMEGL